jgi:uncharacterized repeat protein (TIGR02543 family)
MKKAIPRKIILSLAVVMLATLVAAPMVLASPDATATRTLPATSVAPGANFDVGIVASGCGFMGRVEETLPAGFTYVSSSLDPIQVTQVGQLVRFTIIGDGATFTYTVTAPATAGTYTFDGVVKDEDANPFDVVGDDEVTVAAAGTHTLTIAVTPTGGGTTSPSAGTHNYADDTPVTIYAYAATGYQFSYWSGDASGTSSPTTVTMDDDKSVTAHFVVSTTPQTFAWWLYETFIEPYIC